MGTKLKGISEKASSVVPRQTSFRSTWILCDFCYPSRGYFRSKPKVEMSDLRFSRRCLLRKTLWLEPTFRRNVSPPSSIFSSQFTCPEDGGHTFLRNVGSNHNYTAPDPRRRLSSKVEILHWSQARTRELRNAYKTCSRYPME
jgi:hypothetical protein